jgi:hypothetical protein
MSRREDSAGDLVVAAQESVGEGQHFASSVATKRGEHHGDASEEKHCPAFDGEGGRIPPGEVEGQGQCDAEREAQRAGVVERQRVAANVPPVPGQHESGEANEAEWEGWRGQGASGVGRGSRSSRRRGLSWHRSGSHPRSSASAASIASPMRKRYSRTAAYSDDIQGPPRAAAACAHSYIVRSSASCPEVIDSPSKARTRSARTA